MRNGGLPIHTMTLAAAMLLLLASCEKPETAVTLPAIDPSLRLMTVEMGTSYDQQVFLNLDDQRTTTVNINSWDLCLDAAAGAFDVSVNGGKGVLIATGGADFAPLGDPASMNWKWDGANGAPDSLVLRGWRDRSSGQISGKVYVIDRGEQSAAGERYMQFRIVSADAGKYVFSIADAQGGNIHEVTVTKDPSKVHVYMTFGSGGAGLNIEPPASDWHICFLRYRWIYYEFNPPLLYSVCGIYLNRNRVDAAVDSSMTFAQVNYQTAQTMPFSNARDAMGYDWKVYNFTNGRYVARSFVNYVVRTKAPLGHYKLRFIDFYSDNGLKGSPRFEVQAF